jgi:hypothetical protein
MWIETTSNVCADAEAWALNGVLAKTDIKVGTTTTNPNVLIHNLRFAVSNCLIYNYDPDAVGRHTTSLAHFFADPATRNLSKAAIGQFQLD